MSTGEPSPTSTRRTVAAVFLAGVSVFLVLYETQGLIPAIREAYSIDAPTASLTVSATNVAMACFLIPFSMLAPRIGHARQRLAAMGLDHRCRAQHPDIRHRRVRAQRLDARRAHGGRNAARL